jgi:hypothetical protein
MPNEESLVIPETLLVQLGDGQIVEMPLDEYLKGVVPTEMGLKKPIEALKAQAIASRAFAISTRRHARDGFDVCITTHCQVYKPKNRYDDSDCSVDETVGQVLTRDNKIVGAPFFGHCDGHTRNSEDVWSSTVSYLRSVPCICGYTELYGHGVGMCQRGAAAMAREGSTAEEILGHYYLGTAIGQATYVPRTSFQRSIILGQVVDGQGAPLPGVVLVLHGPQGPVGRRTNNKGQFWISKLPAGEWELDVRDKPIRYRNLVTDGRNMLDLRVVVPDVPPLIAETMPLAYPRQLLGTLGYEGIEVTITDPSGNEQTTTSGLADAYNPGGFAVDLADAGIYTVRFLDQSFDLEVGDSGLWVRFVSLEV